MKTPKFPPFAITAITAILLLTGCGQSPDQTNQQSTDKLSQSSEVGKEIPTSEGEASLAQTSEVRTAENRPKESPATATDTGATQTCDYARVEVISTGHAQPVEETASAGQDEADDFGVSEIAKNGGKSGALLRDYKRSREMGQTLNGRLPAASPHPSPMMKSIRMPSEPVDRENYANFEDNQLFRVAENPVSTFSIDVDTGAYANVRRMLNAGQLPPQDAVRSEEMINYFSYRYPLRAERSAPFAVYKELAPTPWNANTHLLHIGIKGYEAAAESLPAENLVFLIDVSGSMNQPNKLGLLKSSLRLLTQHLDSEDRVSMVVYAGASGVVLDPTPGDQHARIIAALEQLRAGGSTNGSAGLRLAYAMAEQAFITNGINRVLLATDGDFNVGTVGIEQLKDLIEEKRKSGIALSTLGFGTGNYNDHLMEQIADVGNGNYAYIDTLNEAQKVLVDEMSSTMLTIAKDVKIQIEFNPAVVSEYRLVGYENRKLRREDFNNDKIDAGEIGAGHTVTALYEIALVDGTGHKNDTLRYQTKAKTDVRRNEVAFLLLRYKAPEENQSQLLEWASNKTEITNNIDNTSTAFRFAGAVAGFVQLLQGGDHTGNFTHADVMNLANGARDEDPFGYRGEFLLLVNLANALQTPSRNFSQR